MYTKPVKYPLAAQRVTLHQPCLTISHNGHMPYDYKSAMAVRTCIRNGTHTICTSFKQACTYLVTRKAGSVITSGPTLTSSTSQGTSFLTHVRSCKLRSVGSRSAEDCSGRPNITHVHIYKPHFQQRLASAGNVPSTCSYAASSTSHPLCQIPCMP